MVIRLSDIENILETIPKKIEFLTKKGKELDEAIKGLKLSSKDIPDELIKKMKELSEICLKKELPIEERINKAKKIIEESIKISPKILVEKVLNLRLKEIQDAEAKYELIKFKKYLKEDAIAPLELLISDDPKIKLILKNMGIKEIPKKIRELAIEAKKILEDESIPINERVSRASELLVQPLLPALYDVGKELRDIPIELKGLLWEIAYELNVKHK